MCNRTIFIVFSSNIRKFGTMYDILPTFAGKKQTYIRTKTQAKIIRF